MNVIIVEDKLKRQFVREDPEYLYLFSDNLQRTAIVNSKKPLVPVRDSWYYEQFGEYKVPHKTTAVIRGLQNAYPITTYKTADHEQWSDLDIDLFVDTIDQDINRILGVLPEYKGIKVYNERFGNERISRLEYLAPKCYKYLNDIMLASLEIDNSSLGNAPKFRVDATSFILPEEKVYTRKYFY